jgi:opacity protein-like surface antigen
MKKFVVVILLLLFSSAAYAESFVAVKVGSTQYVKEKDSIYEGSHIYNKSESYGFILGTIKNNWIRRLDISRERTGVEFVSKFPLPYDGVRIISYPITISIGRKVGIFYGLVGAGYMLNSADVWQYPEYPFDAKMNNSICGSAIVGLSKDIIKNLYIFAEARYLYSKAEVEIAGYDSFTEDLSNVSGYAGLGIKF